MFVKSAAIFALGGVFTAVTASPTPDTIQLPDGDCAPHGIHLLVGEWTKVESRFKNENDYWWGPGQDESMSFPRFVFDFDAVKTPPYTREVFFLTTYKPNGQLWGDAQMDLSKLLIDQVMSCTIDAPTGMADKERCHEIVVQYQEPYISGGYADISATCGPITG